MGLEIFVGWARVERCYFQDHLDHEDVMNWTKKWHWRAKAKLINERGSFTVDDEPNHNSNTIIVNEITFFFTSELLQNSKT